MNDDLDRPRNRARSITPDPTRTDPLVRVYTWDALLRACHWMIASCIVVLSITGAYIGHPFWVVAGDAGGHFVMGTIKVIHFYTAIVFDLAVLARLKWLFSGPPAASWRELLPLQRGWFRSVKAELLFHLLARDQHPSTRRHTLLGGLLYLVIFSTSLFLIATGMGLYGSSASFDSPTRFLAVIAHWCGGLQMTRWLHHVAMWLLILCSLTHLLSVRRLAVARRDGTMESMFTGYKWMASSRARRETDPRPR